MKVICDNCRAVYKIPDEKLVKPVNKATCRQCGHRMLIPRPRKDADPDERTLVTAVPPTPAPAPSRDQGPPTVSMDEEPEQTLPGHQNAGRDRDEVPMYSSHTPPPTANRQQSSRGQRQSTPTLVPDLPGPAADEPRAQARGARGRQPTPTPADRHRSAEPVPQERHREPEPAPRASSRQPTREREREPAPAYQEQRTERAPARPQAQSLRESAPPPPRRSASEQRSQPSQASSPGVSHDPAGDMRLAMLGGLGTLFGIVLLFAVYLVGPLVQLESLPFGYWIGATATFLALMVAIGGAFVLFLVLLTGGFGRRPARRFLSIVFATFLAGIVSGVAVGIKGAVDFRGQLIAMAQQGANGGPSDPATVGTGGELSSALATSTDPLTTPAVENPPTEPADAATTDANPEAPAEAKVETPPEPPKETPKTTPKTTTKTKSTSTKSSGTSSKSSGTSTTKTTTSTSSSGTSSATTGKGTASDPIIVPETVETPPPSDLPEKPPMVAIDTMVKSNVGVKKCFFLYQKDNGSLPSKIVVKFRIAPSGSTSGVGITQAEFAGTTLDACLSKAIGGISFPPSQQGEEITGFPFVFN